MDKIIRTSNFVKQGMTPAEKRIFSAVKRDVLKQIPAPRNSDYLMMDIIGCEYIKYVRALAADKPRIAVACAKAMREFLAELNLTPHSRAETNTATTLSTIFKIIKKEEDDHAEYPQAVHGSEWIPELHTR